jgi:hypothetical protein
VLRADRVLLLVAVFAVGCKDKSGDVRAPARDASVAPVVNSDSADASNVVTQYYAAINARHFAEAYRMWGDSGRLSGQTYAAFAAGFLRTSFVRATVGAAGPIEGAAGSRYVTIPVQIEAQSVDSSIVRYTGTYVLRRVVVDGATAEQRAWHINSADMRRD